MSKKHSDTTPKENIEQSTLQPQTRNWITLQGDRPSVYANQAEIHTSNWDIKIRLGEAVPGSANSVIETARIVMSPQHAKAFAGVMADAVRRFEAAFGEIRINPPNVQAVQKEKTQ